MGSDSTHDGMIGKYRVIKHLATGGMGEVFLARQEGLRGFAKVVVVKRLLSQYARDEQFLEMFLNEARLAAQLQHPNVVQVFDLGEAAGTFFLAMEYVHGASLRQVRQRAGTLEPTLAAALVAQALQGLHHAHELHDAAGVPLKLVHRDISPDNLLVGFDGVVKVVDFGIAKATALVSTTTTGTLKGKYAYMAPEYLAGEDIDGRADLYSMGVVLYELLAGTRPFKAATDPASIMAVLQDEPTPLRRLVEDLPAVLEAVVQRALTKDPKQRYQSAREMAVDLERFVAGRVSAGQTGDFLRRLLGPEAAARPSLDVLPPVPPQPAVQATAAPSMEVATKSSPRVVRRPGVEGAVEAPAPRPRRSAPLFVGLGVLLLAGAGVTVAMVKREEPPPLQPQPALAKLAAPQPVPAPLNVERDAGEDAGLVVELMVDAGAPQVSEPPPVQLAAVVDAGAPKAEAKTGRVDLIVMPWAEVRHGTKVLGITPMDPLVLPRGTQWLTLVNPELRVERRVKVVVQPGGTTRVRIDLMD